MTYNRLEGTFEATEYVVDKLVKRETIFDLIDSGGSHSRAYLRETSVEGFPHCRGNACTFQL